MNKNRCKSYDRVMSRVYNRSRTSLKSDSVVTRHEMPSSARVGAKPSVSNVSSSVFSELPTVLNDYEPESSREVVIKTKVVRPRRTVKSLDPAKSPPGMLKKVREYRELGNIQVPRSSPSVVSRKGEGWADSHVKHCYSSRSHTRLKELKEEIKAYNETEKAMRMRARLYKSCGVVLDDMGRVTVDKAVQAEDAVKDKEIDLRLKKWLEIIDRTDLIKPDFKPKGYVVCSKHFDKSSIVYKPQLKPDALPTKYAQKSTSCDQATQTDDTDIIVNIKKEPDDEEYVKSTQTDKIVIKIENPQTVATVSAETSRKRKLSGSIHELDLIIKEEPA